jgi:putative endonuclease
MAFYVYILQSSVDNSFYKGFSEQPLIRLAQHNNGESTYTATKMPWKLIYVEELMTKKEALIREKALKKYSNAQIQQLITSGKNIVPQFGNSVG